MKQSRGTRPWVPLSSFVPALSRRVCPHLVGAGANGSITGDRILDAISRPGRYGFPASGSAGVRASSPKWVMMRSAARAGVRPVFSIRR